MILTDHLKIVEFRRINKLVTHLNIISRMSILVHCISSLRNSSTNWSKWRIRLMSWKRTRLMIFYKPWWPYTLMQLITMVPLTIMRCVLTSICECRACWFARTSLTAFVSTTSSLPKKQRILKASYMESKWMTICKRMVN